MKRAGRLPQSILIASADIAERAEFELACELNPNLPFNLADCLNFAIDNEGKIELADWMKDLIIIDYAQAA